MCMHTHDGRQQSGISSLSAQMPWPKREKRARHDNKKLRKSDEFDYLPRSSRSSSTVRRMTTRGRESLPSGTNGSSGEYC